MPKFNGQNKKRVDPRYFLNEQPAEDGRSKQMSDFDRPIHVAKEDAGAERLRHALAQERKECIRMELLPFPRGMPGFFELSQPPLKKPVRLFYKAGISVWEGQTWHIYSAKNSIGPAYIIAAPEEHLMPSSQAERGVAILTKPAGAAAADLLTYQKMVCSGKCAAISIDGYHGGVDGEFEEVYEEWHNNKAFERAWLAHAGHDEVAQTATENRCTKLDQDARKFVRRGWKILSKEASATITAAYKASAGPRARGEVPPRIARPKKS